MRTSDLKEHVAEVEGDIGDVLRQLHRILRAFGDAAEDVRESMARTASAAGPVQDGILTGKAAVEDAVQKHPWTSLAVAFLTGALLSTLVRR